MDSLSLKAALRSVFDSRVLNHGDYNLVFARPSGTSLPHVVGYRRRPAELVFCPVDPGRDSSDQPGGAASVTTVTLHNVATVADTGTGYQVDTVTGFRTWFEVDGTPRVPVGLERAGNDDGTVTLEQRADAADFHDFMTGFMDELEAYYADPRGASQPRP